MATAAFFPVADAQEPAAAPELPIIEASATDELVAKEGQKVIVHGETVGSGKSPSGTNTVRFKGADFYLVAFKSDLEPFKDGEPAEIYDGQRIAVTGVVSIYRDQPQIKLISPEQVRVLGADETFPPEKPVAAESQADGKPAEKTAIAAAEIPVAEPEKPRENPPVDWRKFFK